MFKKERIIAEDVITYIEFESDCEISGKARKSLLTELEVSYALNGYISQNYIESLVEKFKAERKNEKATSKEAASSINCPTGREDNIYRELR